MIYNNDDNIYNNDNDNSNNDSNDSNDDDDDDDDTNNDISGVHKGGVQQRGVEQLMRLPCAIVIHQVALLMWKFKTCLIAKPPFTKTPLCELPRDIVWAVACGFLGDISEHKMKAIALNMEYSG